MKARGKLDDVDEKGIEVVMRGPKLDKMVEVLKKLQKIFFSLHPTKP